MYQVQTALISNDIVEHGEILNYNYWIGLKPYWKYNMVCHYIYALHQII